MPFKPIVFLRLKPVLERTGSSRSGHYAYIADGLMVPPLHIGGGRAAVWPEHEIEAIQRAILAGWSKDRILTRLRILTRSA
jgi:prophage regulatory protein